MKKTKKCPKCQEIKTADSFWLNAQASDGLASYCKLCFNAIRRDKRRRKVGQFAEGGKEDQRRKERDKSRCQKRKEKVLDYYGRSCQHCGNTDVRVLTMDHINSDGAEHRKTVPGGRLYKWLLKNGCPEGFQTLCMNCQWIKRHEKKEWAKRKRTQI